MQKLVLTGISEFWPSLENEKDALYLGPWCFGGNHKDFLRDQESHKIASSPWKNWDEVAKAQKYIDALIERIVPSLGDDMNRIYGLKHGMAYWRLIFTFWLLHWLAHLYDRYLCLSSCFQRARIEQKSYHIKIAEPQFEEILGQWDFMRMQSTHEYNLELFSDILRIMQSEWSKHFQVESVKLPKLHNSFLRENNRNHVSMDRLFVQTDFTEEEQKNLNYRHRIKRILKDTLRAAYDISALKRSFTRPYALARYLYHKCKRHPLATYMLLTYHYFFFRFRGRRHIVLGNIYGIERHDLKQLGCKDGTYLVNRLMALSKKHSRITTEQIFLQGFQAENEFEVMLKKLIGKYMPRELKQLRIFPRWAAKRLRSLLCVASHGYLHNSHLQAAIVQEQGLVLGSQHGGAYGLTYLFPIGLNEYRAMQGFISWGWEYKHNYSTRVLPMPSPMLSKLKRASTLDDAFYFISTAHPLYYYRFHSNLRPEMQKNYINNKFIFLDELKAGLLSKVMYRPYIYDYGASEYKYVLQKLPVSALVFDAYEHSLRILNSSLLIIDHAATSYLEALAANMPTVLFWQPEQHKFCKEAEPYFEKLRAVKVLFDDPVSAARHINKIENHIEEWWQQEELQSVRRDFCYQYARTSENWQEEWRVFLKKIRHKNYFSSLLSKN